MNRYALLSVSLRSCFVVRNGLRMLSAQVAPSFKPTDEEFLNAKPFEEIPGLSKFEVVRRFMPGGKFHKMGMIDVQQNMRNEFGDFYKIPGMFGQDTLLTIYDPRDIELMHRNEGIHPYRKGLQTMTYFRKKLRSDVYSVGGLIIEQGEDWQRMRSTVNPILMQPKFVKYYIPTIDSIVNEFLAKIPSIQDANGEMPGNFFELLSRWSLESITAIALEKRLGLMDFKNTEGVGGQITRAVRKILSLGMEFEMKPSIWKIYQTKEFKELMDAYNKLTDLSLMIIDEAKLRFEQSPADSKDREQSVLFKLMEKDSRFATVMAFDMIFGGIDTTSSALATMIYCLAKNPDKQEKLRKELMSLMPNHDTPLTGDLMKNMPYLRAVIKESLRLYSPAIGYMRRTTKNIVIKGYQVPQGIDIMIGLMHMFRDEKNFKSPNEFVPERWLKDTNAEACPHLAKSHPFSYLPFGFGARFCVGKRIAEMELEVFISRLFRNYKVEWHHSDIRIKAALVNSPENEMRFKLIKI